MQRLKKLTILPTTAGWIGYSSVVMKAGTIAGRLSDRSSRSFMYQPADQLRKSWLI